jgi:MFS family permease
MKKVLVGVSIGTVFECFDFYLYAAIAGIVISGAYFPTVDPAVATIAALSTFAVGYLARPVGAVIFGHLGDRLGRKNALTLSFILMGISTVAIGLLPTYNSIGIAAPIMLVAIRFVQGIGVGGEFGGAVTMVFEHGHRTQRRALLGSIPAAAQSAGFLVASASLALISAFTTGDQFQEWGWRIPFVASAFFVALGFWFRRTMEESPIFEAAKGSKKTVSAPLVELVRNHPGRILISAFVPIVILATYGLILVYMVSYAKNRGFSAENLLVATTIAQVVYLPTIILSAYLSDRLGSRRLPMMFGAIGSALWSFAFWPLVNTGSFLAMVIALTVALIFIAAVYGPLSAFLAELFPPNVRYSGFSFGYQLMQAIVGGTTPVVAAALVTATGDWLVLPLITAIVGTLSLLAILISRRFPMFIDDDVGSVESPGRRDFVELGMFSPRQREVPLS